MCEVAEYHRGHKRFHGRRFSGVPGAFLSGCWPRPAFAPDQVTRSRVIQLHSLVCRSATLPTWASSTFRVLDRVPLRTPSTTAVWAWRLGQTEHRCTTAVMSITKVSGESLSRPDL